MQDSEGRRLDNSGIAAWCADMTENKFLETAVRGSLCQNDWEPRDWSDIIRKKTQGFGGAPPKRPSQKPLSAQKSFFSRFRARAMGTSRLVGHHTQENARFRRRPPETAVAEALVCTKIFFFFALFARASAMGASRLVGHHTQEDARFRRRPPETAVAEAFVCEEIFFFRVFRACARNGSLETGRTSYARRRKVSAAPPRNGRRRSPCLRRNLFFSRFSRARNGSLETGRTSCARRRKVSAAPPRNGRRRSPCLRRNLFFFAFFARARNGSVETGRTSCARRRKVSAPPPRNGRRRSPCLRKSLSFSRFARAQNPKIARLSWS